jgi:hypothetical protein
MTAAGQRLSCVAVYCGAKEPKNNVFNVAAAGMSLYTACSMEIFKSNLITVGGGGCTCHDQWVYTLVS